jgi:hypothetical protein
LSGGPSGLRKKLKEHPVLKFSASKRSELFQIRKFHFRPLLLLSLPPLLLLLLLLLLEFRAVVEPAAVSGQSRTQTRRRALLDQSCAKTFCSNFLPPKFTKHKVFRSHFWSEFIC